MVVRGAGDVGLMKAGEGERERRVGEGLDMWWVRPLAISLKCLQEQSNKQQLIKGTAKQGKEGIPSPFIVHLQAGLRLGQLS